LLDAALPIYKLVGAEGRLRSHVNDDPGTHNFLRENREAFYKMVGDHFYAGDPSYDSKEIESEKEVKSAEELNVPLPENNFDFHKLALALMVGLPSHKSHKALNVGSQDAPSEPTAESVRRIAKLANYEPNAEMVGESAAGDTKARYWRLKLGDDWTVPVVELYRGTPKSTSCIVADGGRGSVIDQIDRMLSEESRVLAIDPFYLGESKLPEYGNRLALFVSSVGARPLGVQADQLQAVTRWAATKFRAPIKETVAVGPRISLAALIAAATGTEDERPQHLVLNGSLGSLRQIVENNWTIDDYPELFCFGLHEHCDVDDLIELAKPCEVIRK
jgi:hypothetical protein